MTIAKTLFVVVAVCVVVVVIIYLCGYFTQTRHIYTGALALASQVKEYVVKNWALLAGSIGTVVTVGGAALSKLNSVKAQATTAANTAQSQITRLQDEKTKLTTSVETVKSEYEAKLAASQQQVADLQTAGADKTEVVKAQANVQTVIDQNSQFVKSLMTAANGALVANPLDGKTYSVLKLPPEVQVK